MQGALTRGVQKMILFKTATLVTLLLIAILFAVALFRRYRWSWFARMPRLLGARDWAFAVLLAVVAYTGLSGHHILHGDGREYILQTQSIVFDRTLAIDAEARRDYWNATNPYGVTLRGVRLPASTLSEASQAGGGFGGLYPDRFGNYRYYHYWLYSAVIAPVYSLFRFMDPSGDLEYFAFRFVNVCLLLAFFILAYRQRPHGPTLAVLVLLLFSPLIPYADWQHPELFCLVLVFASFCMATRPKTVWASPFLLGLAASMNPPILLFFPCHLMVALRSRVWRQAKDCCVWAAWYALAGLLALSSAFYFLYYFDTPSLISSIGLASLQHASISRAVDIFFNPFVGALYFFPMLLLLLPTCVSRKNAVLFLAVAASTFLAAWLATSTSNLNAGQVGTVRYAVWLLAPLWYCLFSQIPTRFERTRRGKILIAALGLSVLMIIHFRTYELLNKEIQRFGGSRRARPEVATLVRLVPYVGDVEIAVENILGHELAPARRFNGIYLWDLGSGHTLWIFSERSVWRQRPVVFQVDNPDEIQFTASPAQPVLWKAQDKVITLLPWEHPKMHNHPVLGKYLMLRSKGNITRVLNNQSFSIRSATIEQAPADEELKPAPGQQNRSGLNL